MKRAYYSDDIKDFLYKNEYEIFGELTSNDQFSAEDLQKNTWKKEIQILKRELADFSEGYLLFEYTIPRIGDRIDAVFLYKKHPKNLIIPINTVSTSIFNRK